MKLIDLLVKELPKRGGWPDGVKGIEQNPCGCLLNCVLPRQPFLFDGEMFDMCDDWKTAVATREQYEAAAQQPAWNGEGLPPVGAICEAKIPRSITGWEWRKVKVVESGISGAENEALVYDLETTHPSWTDEFRPIRSEADKKRDEVVDKIYEWADETFDVSNEMTRDVCEILYDAIAAGKIPGVKLED